MVKIAIEYSGELHCVATHGPSNRQIETDAPIDNQGRGESFSPTDLVAAALGTCMGTIMGIYARRHGIDLVGMKIEVEKEMALSGPRRIARLSIHIWMPPDAKRDTSLENAAYSCPVHHSLSLDIEKPVVFHWGTGSGLPHVK